MNELIIAAQEARAYARRLTGLGYGEVSLWRYGCALTDYGPESSRTTYAAGYAVQYAGTLTRADGTRAEHPTAGITVFCQDGQLPLARLLKASRALVTFGTGDWREYGPYTPYYVASWNDRDGEAYPLRVDQSVNPGTLQTVILHAMTPLLGGDGPKRFYDLRMDPAGDFLPGDRVVVTSGQHTGDAGIVQAGMSVANGHATVVIETYAGNFRTVGTDTLEPFTFPVMGYVYGGDIHGNGDLIDAVLCETEAAWRELIAAYPWHGLGTPRVLARERAETPDGGWPLT